MLSSALVCDWLVTIGGGEKVLEAIYEIFPSPIYSLVHDPKNLKGTFFENKEVKTSFLQKFPKGNKYYRYFFPFYPLAIEQFNLSQKDLIISCSSSVAKGVLTHSDQLHICYCYTPVRYAWDLYFQYLTESNLTKGLKAHIVKFFMHYLRMWDINSVNRVDIFVAISHFVARRIKKIYGKESEVIYPPVDVDYFKLTEIKEDYYLTASRMVPYKKIDLIVEAFSKMPDKKLIVIGDGPDFKKIKSKASQNIELLGYQNNDVLKSYMSKAKAFVFAALEDFGIVPIEAQACGTPVIALQKGGVLETVISDVTGVFFPEQTIEDLVAAVNKFEKKQDSFVPYVIRKHAEKFSKKRFQEEFSSFVNLSYAKFKDNL